MFLPQIVSPAREERAASAWLSAPLQAACRVLGARVLAAATGLVLLVGAGCFHEDGDGGEDGGERIQCDPPRPSDSALGFDVFVRPRWFESTRFEAAVLRGATLEGLDGGPLVVPEEVPLSVRITDHDGSSIVSPPGWVLVAHADTARFGIVSYSQFPDDQTNPVDRFQVVADRERRFDVWFDGRAKPQIPSPPFQRVARGVCVDAPSELEFSVAEDVMVEGTITLNGVAAYAGMVLAVPEDAALEGQNLALLDPSGSGAFRIRVLPGRPYVLFTKVSANAVDWTYQVQRFEAPASGPIQIDQAVTSQLVSGQVISPIAEDLSNARVELFVEGVSPAAQLMASRYPAIAPSAATDASGAFSLWLASNLTRGDVGITTFHQHRLVRNLDFKVGITVAIPASSDLSGPLGDWQHDDQVRFEALEHVRPGDWIGAAFGRFPGVASKAKGYEVGLEADRTYGAFTIPPIAPNEVAAQHLGDLEGLGGGTLTLSHPGYSKALAFVHADGSAFDGAGSDATVGILRGNGQILAVGDIQQDGSAAVVLPAGAPEIPEEHLQVDLLTEAPIPAL